MIIFIQPDHWIDRSLRRLDHALFIDNEISRALDQDDGFLQSIAMINLPFRICEDRERQLQFAGICLSELNLFAENGNNLCIGIPELFVVAPQLGDKLSALPSSKLAHKEQDDMAFPLET